MKKSKLLAILLCVVMLVAVASACNNDNGASPSSAPPSSASPDNPPAGDSQDSPGPAATSRETVTIALSSDEGSLSPAFIGGDYYRVALCIQEPMWDVKANGDIIWLLAESVDVNSPTHWTVHLRQGVTFSNGNPFTADDVLFSLRVTRESGRGTPRAQEVDFDRTVKVDDNTIELYWDRFHSAQWQILSDMVVYDEESYDVAGSNTNPIGTGPYVLTEYVINSHCNLERREDYWGELPQVKYLRFRVMAEPSQVANALETGAIDIGPIAAQDYEFVDGLPGYTIYNNYQANWVNCGFYFGENSAFYHNPDARYAVCYAINKEAILSLAYDGRGKVMNCPVTDICINHKAAYENAHSTYTESGNLELAKQYAESSGLAGKTITLICTSEPALLSTAELIQGMLAQIDVTVKIESYDSATIYEMLYDVNATYDMSLGLGICPSLEIQGPLINGVRFNPVVSAPGSFEGKGLTVSIEEFLEKSVEGFFEEDAAKREEVVDWIVKVYLETCVTYGLVDVQFAYAYPSDMTVVPTFRSQMQYRYQDMRFG